MKISSTICTNGKKHRTHDLSPVTTGVFHLCSFVNKLGNNLLAAYSEYLEQMLLQSDDLVTVDVFTVPSDVDPDSPSLSEWADVV